MELVVLEGNKNALSKGDSTLRKRCGQPCQFLLKCQEDWVSKLDYGMW